MFYGNYYFMKKLIIAIFLFVVLCNSNTTEDFSLLKYFNGEYTVYTKDKLENSLDLGFCYMSNNIETSSIVVGESMILKNYEVGKILKDLNAQLIKTECLDDGTSVIYAYSNLIRKQVKCDDNDANIQIAVKEDYIVVGWPLILGSF